VSEALEITEGDNGPEGFALQYADYVPGSGGGGGGGGGTSVGGVVNQQQPVVFGSPSPPANASFTQLTDSVIEGGTRTYTVQLSEQRSQVSVVDLQIGTASTSAGVTLSTYRIEFPIGGTGLPEVSFQAVTSTFSGGDPSTLTYIELVETPFQDLEGREGLAVNAAADTIALTVIDDNTGVGDPPTWTFDVPGGAINVPEGVPATGGVATFHIQLNAPALQTETFDVRFAGGTAQPGLEKDYLPFDQVVTILTGESQGSFDITFPQNQTRPPNGNPTVVVRGEALPGSTATAGAVTEFTVTILDDDEGGSGSGIHRINWQQANVTLAEGGTRTVSVYLTVGGTQQGYAEEVYVPLTFVGDEQEFQITYPSGVPGELFFAAGSAVASIDIESINPGTAGALTLGFDLTGGTTPTTLREGARPELAISSTLASTEPTTIHVPAMAGASRRMIQALVAVNPPSVSLPFYRLKTGPGDGELVQVVGHMRDAEGRWIAATVYALAPGTESIAGTSSAFVLEPAESGGSTPAPVEDGDFTDSPILTFRLAGDTLNFGGPTVFGERVTNTGDFSQREGSIPTSAGTWTGVPPSSSEVSRWPQVGPQIVHQRSYLMRPMRVGATQNINLKSPDTLGYIELCETRIAGDPNVILYEGQWVNGAWAGSQHADVESFEVNPYCDGPVELNLISAAIYNGTFGNLGWKLDLVDAHPAQFDFPSDSAKVQLLTGRGEPYYFPTCQAYTFRFVAVRDGAEPDALLRAHDYHRCKNIAWAVGGLGSTRNRIYGDTADLTVDWGRAALEDEPVGGNAVGWNAIKSIGEDIATGFYSSLGCIADWVGGGLYPFSQSTHHREGWQHPLYPAGGGIASGQGIYGSGGHVPWWGYWYLKTMELHKITNRVRHQYRDVLTSATPFWWYLADEVAGEWVTPISGSFISGTARNRHWHFASAFDSDEMIGLSSGDPDTLRLAPTPSTTPVRPWIPTTSSDPQWSRIRSYETFKETHMPRERSGHVDGWWGMRSFLAYKAYEGRAASMTRAHPPIPSYGSPESYTERNSNFANNLAGMEAHPEFEFRGMQVDEGGAFMTGGFLRAWGWLMVMSGGFYSIADTATRENYRGEGFAANRGAKNWFLSMTQILEFITEDTGLIGRQYGGGNPIPNNQKAFGLIDYCGKTGRSPYQEPAELLDCRPLPGENLTAPGALLFHQIFCARGVEVLRNLVIGDDSAYGPDFLRRALEYHANYIAGARAFTTTPGPPYMPYFAFAAFDSDGGYHNLHGMPLPIKSTLADLQSGKLYWYHNKISAGAMGPIGFTQHNSKCGWSALAAFRALGDDSHLDIPKSVYGRSMVSDAAFVEYLMRGDSGSEGIQNEMTATNGSKRVSPLGERSFLLPILAEYLNRTS
jgi:hypothetical protein